MAADGIDVHIDAVALAAASEINTLRENVVRLGQHSLALNGLCYELAVALGDIFAGDPQINVVPLDLVRRIVEHRDMLEAKLTAVREAVEGPNVNCNGYAETALVANGCFVSNALQKIKAVLDA